jgi:molybdopterin-guanine dinucleotide biosynthesis protein A
MTSDKGLRELGGEPLVRHVIRRLLSLVDEVLLVVGSEGQRAHYSEFIGGEIKILVDLYGNGSPLVGAITGFKHARGEYALVTGCDMPFVSPDVVKLLFDEGEGFNGAVFQWPNGWIEPLIAVYRVEPSLKAAQDLYRSGNLRIRMILLEMSNVKKIPIKALRAMDPDLLTLYDIDTEDTLLRAEEMLKNRGKKEGMGKPPEDSVD